MQRNETKKYLWYSVLPRILEARGILTVIFNCVCRRPLWPE